MTQVGQRRPGRHTRCARCGGPGAAGRGCTWPPRRTAGTGAGACARAAGRTGCRGSRGAARWTRLQMERPRSGSLCEWESQQVQACSAPCCAAPIHRLSCCGTRWSMRAGCSGTSPAAHSSASGLATTSACPSAPTAACEGAVGNGGFLQLVLIRLACQLVPAGWTGRGVPRPQPRAVQTRQRPSAPCGPGRSPRSHWPAAPH